MDAIISIIARFTNLPEVVPSGASRFDGALTVWPSKYDGGKETASAGIVVGSSRDKSVFNLYAGPSVVSAYAGATMPGSVFGLELGVRPNGGAAELELLSVSEAVVGPTTALRMPFERPVLTQVDGGLISVLRGPEDESHFDIAAPAGMSWNPGLERFVGMTLPAFEVVLERRLVPGTVQPPVRCRAVAGDERLFVAAHPVADLSTL